MKYVAVRILEQWVNLKEYFLTFLPKQKNFNALFKTDRYKRICEALRNDIQTQGYLGFCAFSAQDFEAFLVQFQTESPMIHMLYPGMCKLLNSLLQKFILPKKLKNDNGEFKSQPEILMIDFYKIENHRKLSSIELGTKVKLLLHGAALPNLVDEKFRTECKEFYIASASYLQENLPFHVSLLKYAQFLRPKKRIAPGATSAISNLTLKVASVLEKQLGPVFHLNDISSTKESLCDKVRDQWLSYQNEVIPEHFYINSQLPTTSVAQQQTSYWSYAFSTCYLNSISKQSKYKRIDNYWSQVGTICDEAGNLKFPQLLALVKCVLTFSHGNSSPERGFSINKNFIEGHSTNLKEDTIVALRLVKDELNQVGGVMNFPVTSNLIKCCKESHQRYEVYLAEQTKLVKAESEKVKQTELLTKSLQQRKTDLELIEADIRVCKAGIEVAETAIDEGNGKLQQALLKVKLDKTVCQTSQAMIDMGIKRKRELQINLDNLEKKKKLVK
ncbi:uncharacterized protein LOC136075251 [Hydra vulgaris]|uniref:Uncharacterized protein LOC136075251 n=1 Tax=Hydra vulgaris TaxID=6087 RepID=A0ABM4B4W0_HYDVU